MLEMMISHREPWSVVPNGNHVMKLHDDENLFSKQSYGRHVITAATELSINSSTEVIDVHSMYPSNQQFIQHIEITVTNGKLHSLNRIDASLWVRILTIAKDCHSSNVLLMSTEKGVYLKTIKIIAAGEPLVMWFTEQLLAAMSIPYLLPQQIRGVGLYTCDTCHVNFQDPNPLKIHLALLCDRYDKHYLWIMLARDFHLYSHPGSPSKSLEPYKPYPIPALYPQQFPSPQSYPMDYPQLPTPPSVINSNVGLYSPTSSQISSVSGTEILSISPQPVPTKPLGNYYSAFKPYNNSTFKETSDVTENRPQIRNGVEEVPRPLLLPMVPMSDKAAAEIENALSNLGKTKKGHRCRFCGNMYSRKYGLKIHIRTHTGYKPLHCQICNRAFGDPSNLNKHVRLHADQQDKNHRYKCGICSKVLMRRRDLDRHMKTKHDDDDDDSSENASDAC